MAGRPSRLHAHQQRVPVAVGADKIARAGAARSGYGPGGVTLKNNTLKIATGSLISMSPVALALLVLLIEVLCNSSDVWGLF